MGNSLKFAAVFLCIFLIGYLTKARIPDTPQVTIALLGDTGADDNFGSALKLAVSENADAIMINGDLGYNASAEEWSAKISSSIDVKRNFVIGSLGNHDTSEKDKYISVFNNLRPTNGICTGTSGISEGHDITAVDEVCTFQNVSVISSAIGQVLTPAYLESRLENKLKSAGNNWKLVGYHFTLKNMNHIAKGDENTFNFFDIIRRYGAMGAQAHTHSAMATCPISSPFLKGGNIQCHPEFNNLDERFVFPGVGIYFDSSLGGKESRKRGRCKTPNEANCNHLVDTISAEGYSRIDGLKSTNFNRFGVLFIKFNVGGDPTKALAYFKSIDGQTIFKFTITR